MDIFGVIVLADAVLLFLLIRLWLVGEHTRRANRLLLGRRDCMRLLSEYKPYGHFNRRVLDLRKWTFRQMFPGL